MAGAGLPSDLSADRTCYRIWWPEGEDWYSLLIGAISRLYRRDYWATNDADDLQELSETVLNAISASLDDRGCEMRVLGEIVAYPGEVPPAGWVVCDGRGLDPDEYVELFGVIGFKYGGGPLGVFRIPDLQRRVPVGRAYGDSDFGSLGNVGGEKTHPLTVGEMPSHSHQYTAGSGINRTAVDWGTSPGTGTGIVRNSGGSVNTYSPLIQPTGSDQPHNNLQPFQTVNYIIYIGAPG